MGNDFNDLKFDAHQYARDFEAIAVKIVEHLLSEGKAVLSSGITKATRDYGVDGIIVVNDNTSQENTVVTIEAKLRRLPNKLALKDIATSIVCFLVRYGQKHYIVTNTYLTSPTVEILSRFHCNGECQFQYISGKQTFHILSQIMGSLDSKLQPIARSIQEHFREYEEQLQEVELSVSENVTEVKRCPLQSQANIVHEICQAMMGDAVLFILYGESGVGKYFTAQQAAVRLRETFLVFTFHAQTYHTPRLFFLQLMNTLLGISIHEVLYAVTQDFSGRMPQFDQCVNLPEQKHTLEIFQKLFLMEELSEEGVEFLIYQYIREFFSQKVSQPVLIILHGYTDQAKELSQFILKYLPELPRTIKFLILAEDPWGNTSLVRDTCVILDPAIQLRKIEPLECDEAIQYIQWYRPYTSNKSAEQILRELGGNLEILSEVLGASDCLINLPQYYSLLSNQSETVLRQQIGICLSEPDSPAANLLFLVSLFSGSIPLYAYHVLCQYLPLLDTAAHMLAGLLRKTSDALELSKPFLFQSLKEHFFVKAASYREFAKALIRKSREENWFIFGFLSQTVLLFFACDPEFGGKARSELKRCQANMEFSLQYDLQDLLCRYYEQKEEQTYDPQVCNERLEAELTMYELLVRQDTIDSQLFRAKNEYLSGALRVRQINYSQQTGKQKRFLARLFIRYALAVYQYCIRSNALSKAGNVLEKWRPYLKDCEDQQLFSQYTRYDALLLKESGHIHAFLKKLSQAHSLYPQNDHLACVYFANQAAVYRMSNPEKSLRILEKIALQKVSALSDLDLRFWLQNDAITYRILSGQTDWTRLRLDAETILEQSRASCQHQNEARACNNLGVISFYQNNEPKAREYFYEAVRQMIIYEENFIGFYLAANYLQCLPFDANQQSILGFCLRFCDKNQEMILQKFHDPACPRKENNMFAAFLTVCRTAKTQSAAGYAHLEGLYGSEFQNFASDIWKETSLHERFWFRGRIIILF